MKFAQITPLILTYNEESNVARVLARLQWSERIIIIDNNSTDGTVDILENNRRVEVHQRTFDNYRDQWNYGLNQIKTDWVLTLDADYLLSDKLIDELRILDPTADGYRAPFIYLINGKPLNRSLYPPRVVLFRRAVARYIQDGHTQRLKLDGRVEPLNAPIYHDDRKPLSVWLKAQQKYARDEAKKLSLERTVGLNLPDRLRRWYIAPFLIMPYCLLAKRLVLDGRAGFYYTLQRTYAEVLLALRLLERDLGLTR